MKRHSTAAATVDARVLRLVMKLREQGIADTGVLAALERVPREAFVLDSFAERAYDNKALPIDQGQTISQPYIVAYMSEALRLDDRHKVLEVGTGSGYQTAILSKLCRRVYTIERYPSLLAQAEARFAELGLYNITSRVGDGRLGWPEQAPFPRIIVTAAAAEVPATLVDQLAVDGVMVAPVGAGRHSQHLVRLTRGEEGVESEELIPVRFVPLVEGIADER